MSQPIRDHLCWQIGLKDTNLVGCLEFASWQFCQIQQSQRRSQICISQLEASAAILILIENIEYLLPVKCYQIPFSSFE